MATFPNRPNHPDFWLMSKAVTDLDTASENGVPVQNIIGNVDEDSLTYMARQRGIRASILLGKPIPVQAAAAAAWIDGFMAGARFRELKQA